MSITWSVRSLLLIPFAAAALTVGCGEGNVLQSPTGPSATVGSGTLSIADDADGTVATAASTDEFSTLAKGGNGKGNNGGGNGNGNGNGGGKDSDDDDQGEDEDSGNRGPGNSGGSKVVGFVSAKTFDSLTVNGVTITAAPGAVIRHGNRSLTLGNIGIGDHIQARGTRTGTTLVATEIKVENTNHEDDDDVGDVIAPMRGVISGLTPTPACPAVTFMIGTTKVTTSAATTFDDVVCSALANGALVEVTGTIAADHSIAATKVELQSGPNEVRGTVSELTGTATCGTATPALTFKVTPTIGTAVIVKTTTTTAFTGGTPVVTCATLANGMNVEVEGTTQADLSLTAASVEQH